MGNFFLYLSTVLIWGSTWLAIKFQLGEVSPLVSIAYRFFIAATFLLIIILFKNKSLPRLTLKEHGWVVLLGACMFCINYAFYYLSASHLVSGLVAVVFSTVILYNIGFSALFFRKPIGFDVMAGAMIGLVGVITIFWPIVICSDFCASARWGVFYGLVGTGFASLGNMISAHLQRKGLTVMKTTTYGMFYGATLTALIAFMMGAEFKLHTSTLYISSLFYLSIPGSALAFWCYLTLLGRIGPERSAYALVATPVVALIISSFYEGLTWSIQSYVGIVLVILGNFLVLYRKRA